MIYPVVFWPGSYGSVVCHFINLHKNFYQLPHAFTPTEFGIARQLDGPFHIGKDGSFLINKKSRRPLNSYVKSIIDTYDIAVKTTTPHEVLELDDFSNVKPIVVIPNLSNLQWRIEDKNEHLHVPLSMPTRHEYKQWLKDIESYEHFKLNIDDFWSWAEMRDAKNLDKSYLKLCEYIDSEPRPTVGLDISRIEWFVVGE